MPEDFDKVGSGDTRFSDDETKAGSKPVDGNPGYESEAAYRHRNHNQADTPEIRSTQLMPGPLDEHDEPSVAPEQLPMRENVRHHIK